MDRQWLDEVFGDSPEVSVDDFLQENYDKTHRQNSRGYSRDSLPLNLLPFEVDARQIHAIRWNVTNNAFEGRLTATLNEGEKAVPLTDAWVEGNFDERYLRELKVVAATKQKFTMVPTGDCLDASTLPSELAFNCAPMVRYQQGDQDLCAIYGPASALHYMNMREAAKAVAAMASDIVKNGSDASIVWRVAQK